MAEIISRAFAVVDTSGLTSGSGSTSRTGGATHGGGIDSKKGGHKSGNTNYGALLAFLPPHLARFGGGTTRG